MIGKGAPGNSTIEMSTASQEFQRGLVDPMPWLLSYARKPCGNSGSAEDITQRTPMKAWRSRHRFQSGTNLKAWPFAIVRNEFYSRARRSGRKWTWDESLCERIPLAAPLSRIANLKPAFMTRRTPSDSPLQRRKTVYSISKGQGVACDLNVAGKR